MGDRLAALRAARAALESYVTITAASHVYETQPAYVTDQPAFLNAAIVGTTQLDPLALLFTTKEIERQLGRKPTFHYGPRLIDIDIIFYDSLHMHAPELVLPHPLLAERSFVLRPLADIAGGWPHPVTSKTVREMLAALPEDDGARDTGEAL